MRTAIAFFLLSATPAFAQVHGGDVELEVVDGKIVTGERVYAAEFGESIPNEVDEPGFDSVPGTFPIGSSIRFSLLDALRKWNGADFDAIPTETLSIGFGSSLGPITTPTTSNVVDGFDLNVASDGSWHRHYDFVLNAPATTGIYLLQMRLASSNQGLEPTDPLFIVFNQNDLESNHDAAIAFVESSLAVPEPKAVLLAMMSLVAVSIGRRWRKIRG